MANVQNCSLTQWSNSLGVGATDGEAELWYLPPRLPHWLSVMFYGVAPTASELL